MARADRFGSAGSGFGAAAPTAFTFHQQMLAEIEAALCARDPGTACVHIKLANDYARRCSRMTDGTDRPAKLVA